MSTEKKVNLLFHNEFISSQESHPSHPLLENPPYDLTLPIAELITPKERQTRKKKTPISGRDEKYAGTVINFKDESDNTGNDQINTDDSTDNSDDCLIPRPHNAFIIFRTDYAERMKRIHYPKKFSIRVISKWASKQWEIETEIVKAFFQILAEMYLQRHKIKYPDYKYTPKNRKRPSNTIKKSKPSKPTLSKAKRDELRKQRKDRIITWNINDVITDESSSVMDSLVLPSYHPTFPDAFQFTDVNNDVNIDNNNNSDWVNQCIPVPEENPFQQVMQTTTNHSQQQQITFLNYTASPLSFNSTTTSPSYHYSSQYDDNTLFNTETISDNSSVSSASLEDYIIWTDLYNHNAETEGLSLFADEHLLNFESLGQDP